jgi:hypothetical protein
VPVDSPDTVKVPADDTMLLHTPSDGTVPTLSGPKNNENDLLASPNITTSAIPSTENGGPSHSNFIVRYSDETQWPAWLSPAVEYLNKASDAPEWHRLVKNFIVLEGLQKFSTASKVSHLFQMVRSDIESSMLTGETRCYQPP